MRPHTTLGTAAFWVELVREYVNARRRMAVCTFLHTKGEMSVLSVQNKDGEIFVERLTEKI